NSYASAGASRDPLLNRPFRGSTPDVGCHASSRARTKLPARRRPTSSTQGAVPDRPRRRAAAGGIWPRRPRRDRLHLPVAFSGRSVGGLVPDGNRFEDGRHVLEVPIIGGLAKLGRWFIDRGMRN